MSIVTKSIVNADAEARYLSPGELENQSIRHQWRKSFTDRSNFNRIS